MNNRELEDLREEIQDDIICILDSNPNIDEDMKDMICQVVVDRINAIINKAH